MTAIRSISSGAELKDKNCTADESNYFLNGAREQEKIKPEQKINEVKENDAERINISISRKAYYALEAFTNEFNHGQSSDRKPLTIEEALEEEILLLFSDEWGNRQRT
jgi:hypothetical protein